MSDRVRVVALGPEGSQCSVIYPVEDRRWPGETDAAYYPRLFDDTLAKWGATGQPYVDTSADQLPAAPQEQWRLIGGQIEVVP
jgi:hypothetical protein